MAILRNDQFRMQVQLIDLSYVIVNDISTLGIESSQDVGTFAAFGRTVPHKVTGPKDKSFSVEGYFSPGDAGQDRLRVQEAAGFEAGIKVMWDGTNGFTQLCYVSSYSFDADANEAGLQGYGFTFAPDSTAVIVGAGPIL